VIAYVLMIINLLNQFGMVKKPNNK